MSIWSVADASTLHISFDMVDITTDSVLPLARPPTPPKDRKEGSPHPLDNESNFPSLTDPTESPDSSVQYRCDAFGRVTKKVDFSPWNQFYKPMRIGSKSPDPSRALRPLPPSRERRSAKSILKCPVDSSPIVTLPSVRILDTTTMATTMPSIMDALSQSSLAKRRDAYLALQGCLNVWESLVDPEKFVTELGRLWLLIERDCLDNAISEDSESAQVATHALKLYLTIISIPMLENEAPIALREQILKQALACTQNDLAPAATITQYMQILTRPVMLKSLTTEQIQTLFSNLDKQVRFFKGNRLSTLRMMIYQGLLKYVKSSFISNTQWIDHVIAGVLSSHRELRTRAIAFGSNAALVLGTNSSVLLEWTETLNRRGKEGQTVFEFMTGRMKAMVGIKDETTHVPQIWSMVTLFLRSHPKYIERWEHFKPWLGILQKCFNASDFETKAQANLAWDKLVFAINPDSQTSHAIIGVLCQPIVSQLERKSTQKHIKQSRISARSSFCNLVYYAFRPGASHEHLDLYWDRYIYDLMSKAVSKSSSDIGFFCKVLAMLFTSTTPRPWDEDSACRCQFKKPEHLPSLEPKWVRSRVHKILQTFQLFDTPAAWRPDSSGKAPFESAWRAFTQAIGLAASKEIKVSMDTVNAMAAVLNNIRSLISSSPVSTQNTSQQASLTIYGKVGVLIDGAVSGIGPMPFNERRVVRSSQHSFVATETPSGRATKHQGVLNSPAYHLLALLTARDNCHGYTSEMKALMEQLVAVSLRTASSRSKELATLRSLALLSTKDDHVLSEAAVCLWEVIAAFATESLLSPRTVFHGESPPQLGHEFRDCIRILETGINLRSLTLSKSWQELLAILKTAVVEETCLEALNLAVSEPLAASTARTLNDSCDGFQLDCSLHVLRLTRWSSSRQDTEHAHKMLWGANLLTSKESSLEPFEHVCALISAILELIYRDTGFRNGEKIAEWLEAVAAFIGTCPPTQGPALLGRLGSSISAWIEDKDGRVTSVSFGDAAKSCKVAVGLPTRMTAKVI